MAMTKPSHSFPSVPIRIASGSLISSYTRFPEVVIEDIGARGPPLAVSELDITVGVRVGRETGGLSRDVADQGTKAQVVITWGTIELRRS